MKIYTKQGDKGRTSVYTNNVLKVDKDDLLLECYGTLDELNAHLGLIAKLCEQDGLEKNKIEQIQHCQHQLFAIGFAISDNDKLSIEQVNTLEQEIDKMQNDLPVQTSFILPGGSVLASQVHIARTVARRAERRLVSLSKVHSVNEIALTYLNRLSDYLFVFARSCNSYCGIKDITV